MPPKKSTVYYLLKLLRKHIWQRYDAADDDMESIREALIDAGCEDSRDKELRFDSRDFAVAEARRDTFREVLDLLDDLLDE